MNWYLVLAVALFPYSDAFPTKQKPFSNPPFCRGLECPEYEVKMKTEDFEERCYAEYKWASTDVSGNGVLHLSHCQYFTFAPQPPPSNKYLEKRDL